MLFASAERIFVQCHYRVWDFQLCILAPTKDTGVNAAWYGAQSHIHSLFRSWLSFKCPRLWRSKLQRPLPVLSLLRHFHSVHIRSAPARSSLEGSSAIGETGERSENLSSHRVTLILWSGCWKRFNILGFPWLTVLECKDSVYHQLTGNMKVVSRIQEKRP